MCVGVTRGVRLPDARSAVAGQALTHLRTAAAQIGPLLARSLTGDEPAEIPEDLAALLTSDRVAASLPVQAKYHRVTPWVHRALATQPALSAHLSEQLLEQQRDSMALHLRTLGTLAKLADPLDSLGVRWLVMKGPALAKLVYKRPELRPYSDLDVLVERRRIADVVSSLEEVGFRLLDTNWALIARTGAGQVHLEDPTGGAVDLHWHVLFDRGSRQIFAIPMAEMLERYRSADINGITTHVFDPVDTQLHLCIHAAQEGADRLLWLKDLEQVARHDGGDWDELVARARRWGVGLLVAVVLSRARTSVGAPIPEEIFEALAPSRAWRRLARDADRLFPASSSRGYGNPATLLARSTRSDVPSSVANFAGGLGQRLRRLAINHSWQRDSSKWETDSSASLFYRPDDGGSLVDRISFFDWVQDQGD